MHISDPEFVTWVVKNRSNNESLVTADGNDFETILSSLPGDLKASNAEVRFAISAIDKAIADNAGFSLVRRGNYTPADGSLTLRYDVEPKEMEPHKAKDSYVQAVKALTADSTALDDFSRKVSLQILLEKARREGTKEVEASAADVRPNHGLPIAAKGEIAIA